MLMGIADLIPGISSGSVAYGLNIYQILIDALNSISFRLLFKLKVKEFFQKIHFYTLIPLLLGVLLSIVLFTNIVFLILNNNTSKNFFFVIISFFLVFSCLFFSKTLQITSRFDIKYILIGVVFAVVFSYLPVFQHKNLSLIYVFIVAVIASFAMILPGISGGMILLLFNLYETLLFHVKKFLDDLIHLQFFTFSTLFLTIFSLGVLFGIVIFSNLVKHLLKKYQKKMNLILFGLMLGCAFCFTTILTKVALIIMLLVSLNKFNFVKSS
jgi:putative membrane protein